MFQALMGKCRCDHRVVTPSFYGFPRKDKVFSKVSVELPLSGPLCVLPGSKHSRVETNDGPCRSCRILKCSGIESAACENSIILVASIHSFAFVEW